LSSNPPDVFVSYNKNDQRWAEWIAWVLEEAGYEVVIQAWDFRPGGNFVLDMHDALRARHTVAVMSQNYLAAEFTQAEWAAAFTGDPQGVRRKLIPMRVADCQLEGLLGPLIYVDLLNVGEAEGTRRVVGAFAKRAKPKKAPSFPGGRVAPSSDVPFPRDFKPEISIAKLPPTGDKFVAREAELDRLDAAWADPRTKLVVLVAAGGVGKSSLVNRWLDRMGQDGWRGAERVLGWSFYSQGTEATGASGDAFVDYALRWLGYEGQPITSPWEKGQELARRMRAARTLLVLDGLEPLQHPPGQQTGRLKDPAVQALLRELQADNIGLCVVTTRVEATDVAGRAGVVSIDLDTLPKEAGADLLSQLGVVGKRAELEDAAAELGGHALALTLLGTYLRDVCDGDVRRRQEVPLIDEESQPGAHARWVMRSYEQWLGDGPERQVLRLVGLFDRPAEAAAVAALRKDPIAGLTEGLGQGEEKRWRQAVARLVQARLVSEEEGGLDAHPLVREHFGERLREEAPKAWQAGHERLYEHYRAAAPDLPETLDAMMPLYTAVVHGCRAGRVEQALYEVYWRRIRRGSGGFSLKRLGAFGAELTSLAAFFDRPWTRPSAQLSVRDQAWVLNEAGFTLRAVGRLPDAAEPMRASTDIDIERGAFQGAAISAGNLSELRLTLGEVAAAVADGAESVELADLSQDGFQRMANRTTHADALHQAGRWEESAAAFAEAEGMQAERQPLYPRLYSLQGYQYCDLLLWRAEPEEGSALDKAGVGYRAACEEVRERAGLTLGWAMEGHQGSLLDIALDQLSLGRSHLGLVLTSPAPDYAATEHLSQAVAGLRKAGAEHHIPRGLLARAALHRLSGNPALAHADLTEAEDIATRGHMRLHETDAHLEWTRLCRDTGDLAAAREHLAKARALVDATGYERRRREVDWLTRQLEPT
jgi:tetratricopeptide (TPR) repeat protein